MQEEEIESSLLALRCFFLGGGGETDHSSIPFGNFVQITILVSENSIKGDLPNHKFG